MLRKAGYKFIELIYYIRFFGTTTGIYTWYKINFTRGRDIQLNTSFFANPVYLRKKDSDTAIFAQVFGELQYKWPEAETLAPKVIVDAGANVGLAALFFARMYPQATIYCIEPDPANYEQLKKNTCGYPSIFTLNAALWPEDKPLRLNYSTTESASIFVQTGQTDFNTEGKSIPSIQQQFGLQQIDILKVDIEGAEKELFEHPDLSWLDDVKILVIELHDLYKAGTASAFFSAVTNRIDKLLVQGENVICYLKQPSTT
jgi:FkbM family methyltransferase